MVDTDEPKSPAEFIRQQLAKRGMTQGDLAYVLGVQTQAVNYLALGRRGVSADMARALAAAFEVSPEYILTLQKAAEVPDELARARRPDPSIARKAKLISTYPIREMVKRGWLDEDGDLEEQLASLLGADSIDDVPHLAHAARKTDYSNIPPAQLAWLFRVKQIARRAIVPAYSEAALRAALPRLRTFMSSPEETRHVPRLLAECGVRFVLVQGLPSGRIDGCCLWIDRSPVIGMSLRYDRIDNFWFVLRHEIEHVLRGDGQAVAMLDEVASDERSVLAELPPEELAANAAASDFCVAKAQMDSWIARKAPFFSDHDLIGFAKRQGVHPGVVAGQLRHRMQDYRVFQRHLVKIQACITPTATVDGWGHSAPVHRRS